MEPRSFSRSRRRRTSTPDLGGKKFPIVLVVRDFWEPLIEFLKTRPLAAATIGAVDLERFVVTDSPEEARQSVTETAMGRFGLRYAPPVKPRWFLGER